MEMYWLTFFPNLRFKSFTFVYVVVQLIIYLITLLVPQEIGDYESNLTEIMFLQVNPINLDQFGMRMPWKILKDGQLWRLFTSLFLNYSFLTVIVNCSA